MRDFVLMGILQGWTEFFPVSSSGHLVLLKHFLSMRESGIFVELLLHMATALALFFYFWKDIERLFIAFLNTITQFLGNKAALVARSDRKLIGDILIVTAITGIMGVGTRKWVEPFFDDIPFVKVALFITGVVVTSTRFRFKGKKELSQLSAPDVIGMGLAQSVAFFPGISRSAMTITWLLVRGFSPVAAFRFSFLIAIPAVIGAFTLEARVSHPQWVDLAVPYMAGFLSSFFSGLLALRWLKSLMERERFWLFGIYCMALSVILLSFHTLR